MDLLLGEFEAFFLEYNYNHVTPIVGNDKNSTIEFVWACYFYKHTIDYTMLIHIRIRISWALVGNNNIDIKVSRQWGPTTCLSCGDQAEHLPQAQPRSTTTPTTHCGRASSPSISSP